MGMYNSSRVAMNPASIQQQPSWAQSQPQAMSTQMQPQMSAGPLMGGRGLQNSLSRPSQTANLRQNYQAQQMTPDAGGVVAGPSQQPQVPQGPSLEQIQAEMARRNVGAQLNANPANSALSGYMMSQ